MKAKFVVSATLKAGKGSSGVEQVATPMLMLAKFSGMNLSADLKGLVASAEGRISDELARSGFSGALGEHLTISLGDKSKQKKVLFVGLGKAGSFNCSTVRDTIKLAVSRALAARCERLSIPIMPDRLTATSLGLNPTAHIIKCVAEDVLAGKKGDGVLEIELVTTPHGKRHVQAGVDKQRRTKSCNPCAVEGKTGRGEGKTAAKSPAGTAKKDASRK